jgi:glutaminyl-tRNA synthetase
VYLHIGHAKSICLNFGIARDYRGRCHLRFDDTNPAAEDVEYVQSIQEDVRWLGFDWGENLFFASDYFEQIYDMAVQLIRQGHAYVCEIPQDQWSEYRGVPSKPGRHSPFRDRSVEENLGEFEKMKQGVYPEGSRVLRARIDMSSPNIHMRDPAIYRIKKAAHHRTGDHWKIYPMYDFTHCLSDAIEGITHSLCTLEFEVHRPLYEWVLEKLSTPCRPQQIEFARLSLSYTVMSKRRLLKLVTDGLVDGWDDPRMPTISGLRRRGYTPASIRDFCETIGVTKYKGITDISVLEHSLRQDLNLRAERAMVVMNPLKVVITNYPQGQVEMLSAVKNPEDASAGTRDLPFGREIYIEKDDFMMDPPKKFFRLGPGREVRLKYAYIIRCDEVITDPETGEPVELRCSYDPQTRSGSDTSGKKVKGTLHWVSALHGVNVPVRMFDRLFNVEKPDEPEDGKSFTDYLNPDSLTIVETAIAEPDLLSAQPGQYFQFERVGYFVPDHRLSHPGKPVFNRSVALKDSWAKASRKS